MYEKSNKKDVMVKVALWGSFKKTLRDSLKCGLMSFPENTTIGFSYEKR